MALVFADRVQETTATTGTGTVTLSGAVSGYQSFATIGNGNTTYYTITSGTAWEVGIGTYTAAGTTLARTTVLSSSAGGTTKITLAGISTVFASYPAERAVAYDAGNSLTLNGTNISSAAWGTAGIGLKQAATTYTDTTSSGSIGNARMNYFAPQTYAASIATTINELYGSYFSAPVAGANVTVTGTRVGILTEGIFSLGGVGNYFEGSNGFNNNFTIYALGNVDTGFQQTSGTWLAGGVSQTGTITLGRSTVSQTTSIQSGATASGSTKTITLGTAGLSGSTTNITIGSAVSGATSTTTMNGNTATPAGTTIMTSGFFYIPSAAGAPSGVPTSLTGTVPMYYDSTNNRFYIYNGAWRSVALT
jgi:hypothetical protein